MAGKYQKKKNQPIVTVKKEKQVKSAAGLKSKPSHRVGQDFFEMDDCGQNFIGSR